MSANLAIVSNPLSDFLLVGPKVVDNLRLIGARFASFDPHRVPIADLDADKNADGDDNEVDEYGEPIVAGDMLSNPTYDHAAPRKPDCKEKFATC